MPTRSPHIPSDPQETLRTMALRSAILSTLLLLSACAVPPSASECRIAHDVFFVLEDPTPERCSALVAACEKLRAIPGVVRVTTGVRDTTQTRDVNRQDFHVALHVEFASDEAYEAYLPHPVHQDLLGGFAAGFRAVEVFDYVTGG